jgi:hypothetical protein
MRSLVLAAALASSVPAPDPPPGTLSESFSGSAFALDDDRLLYRETHLVQAGADGAESIVLYRCADGRPFARKRSRDDGDAQQPDFDLVDARMGYREGVRWRDGRREVYVQRGRDRPELSAPLPKKDAAAAVIDTGFDAFVQRHWDELVRGDALRFDFLVPSRRRFYAFKVDRIEPEEPAPPGSITLRIGLSAWFAFLLPHIDLTYDLASRRLVRYEGLSNVRDLSGRNYRVRLESPRIAFGPAAAPGALAAALEQPLATSCTSADSTASARGHADRPEVTAARDTRNPNP